jgi:hypothetical protein
MIKLDKQFFQPLDFSSQQLEDIWLSAKRQLEIASDSDVPEIVFKFSYEALVKLGILILAQNGYKIRSIPGHHRKIIETTSLILQDDSFRLMGEQMRRQRNMDLYDCAFLVSDKDVKEYLDFIKDIFNKYLP